MSRRARIRIGGRQATGFAIYSVVLAAAGLALTRTSAGAVFGAVLIACAAIVFATKVLFGSGRTACPSCGAMLDDLQRRRENPSVLCSSCGAFHEGSSGELWAVDLNRIADAPRYPARAPDEIRWPGGCSVCGAEATQHVAIALEQVQLGKSVAGSVALSAALAPIGARGVALAMSRRTLDVPHCAAHSDGAKLQASADGAGLDVVFRSLAFQRAFCSLNATASAPLAHYTRTSGPLARLIQSRKHHG